MIGGAKLGEKGIWYIEFASVTLEDSIIIILITEHMA